MPRSLSNLITDDLNELAFLNSDVVASEESIRMLIEYHKEKGLLTNIKLIHKDALEEYLTEQFKSLSFLTTPAHYQFFIEVGSRSLTEQRAPDTIHYCAMDLFIRPGKATIALVTDHARRHSAYYAAFSTLSKNLSIQFVIAGGDYYQVDEAHCPIFTLHHLLLTARDQRLLGLLEEVIKGSDEHVLLDWKQLPPEYIMLSQSLKMVHAYAGTLCKEKHPGLFQQSAFDWQIGRYLAPVRTFPYKKNEHMKVRNLAVKYYAADFAGLLVAALEAKDTSYTDSRLIDMCYQERYPQLHGLLHNALIHQGHSSSTDKMEPAHPLFELAFYHAQVLEPCLNYERFRAVFNNELVLTLMQHGVLEPEYVFRHVTQLTGDVFKIRDKHCMQLIMNVQFLNEDVRGRLLKDEHAVQNLSSLLCSEISGDFLKSKPLMILYCAGLIDMALAERIIPSKINMKHLLSVDNESKLSYLRSRFPKHSEPKSTEAQLDSATFIEESSKENNSIHSNINTNHRVSAQKTLFFAKPYCVKPLSEDKMTEKKERLTGPHTRGC